MAYQPNFIEKKVFPILGNKECYIAWDIIQGHEEQAKRNHGQSLERLAKRGGLGPDELVAVLEDRAWHSMNPEEAKTRLNEIVANWYGYKRSAG